MGVNQGVRTPMRLGLGTPMTSALALALSPLATTALQEPLCLAIKQGSASQVNIVLGGADLPPCPYLALQGSTPMLRQPPPAPTALAQQGMPALWGPRTLQEKLAPEAITAPRVAPPCPFNARVLLAGTARLAPPVSAAPLLIRDGILIVVTSTFALVVPGITARRGHKATLHQPLRALLGPVSIA